MFGCLFTHKWKHETVREVLFTRRRVIVDIPIGPPVEFMQVRQYRTCKRCGTTEDRQITEYRI